MNTLDEFDLMGEQDENSTLGLPKLNYGKCTITSRFVQWADKVPTEVTAAQFQKLDPKARTQEAIIAVDIQEFNPTLQFTYTRKINVGGLDWNKIFKPSLFKALGVAPNADKAEQAKQLASALRKLNGAYVCVEDVPQTLSKKDREAGLTESKYNTAKLIGVYPDRAACYAAHKSTYGGGANGASEVADAGPAFASGVPEGYTAASWAEQREAFLSAYNAHVQTLKGAVPQKRKQALAYVAENEAGSTPEQLAELIGV